MSTNAMSQHSAASKRLFLQLGDMELRDMKAFIKCLLDRRLKFYNSQNYKNNAESQQSTPKIASVPDLAVQRALFLSQRDLGDR
jgi:hypothetical protein